MLGGHQRLSRLGRSRVGLVDRWTWSKAGRGDRQELSPLDPPGGGLRAQVGSGCPDRPRRERGRSR